MKRRKLNAAELRKRAYKKRELKVGQCAGIFAEHLAALTPVYSGAVLYHLAEWIKQKDSSLANRLYARIRMEHDPDSVRRAQSFARQQNVAMAGEYGNVLRFLGVDAGIPVFEKDQSIIRANRIHYVQDFTHWNVFHQQRATEAMMVAAERVYQKGEDLLPQDPTKDMVGRIISGTA